MNRIEEKFIQLKKNDKKAFIAFITAGYPDLSVTEELILEFEKRGVDIVELGVPFSDPLADGPVIQESSRFALAKNTHLPNILSLVKRVRKVTAIPICLMTYYNPVFCFGEEKLTKEAKLCGVDGLIIPDLPPEEGVFLRESSRKENLDIIFFLSPTSTAERIKIVSSASKGFIYYVSLTGVTGIRKRFPDGLIENIKLIKRYTSKPLCVGFGVSESNQVREICSFADGVIVGSAIVKKIKENIERRDLAEKVGDFIRRLKTGAD